MRRPPLLAFHYVEDIRPLAGRQPAHRRPLPRRHRFTFFDTRLIERLLRAEVLRLLTGRPSAPSR
jgi:hypothetical protein